MLTPDTFETRRVYRVTAADGEPVYTSRIDQALAPGALTPDLSTIASQWRFINSFSTGTIFKNVSRVRPTEKRPLPTSDPTASMLRVLRSMQDLDVVLMLSGGLDSRALMALLHGAGVSFRAVTYGVPSMPDWKTAEQVSTTDGIAWQGIDVRSLPVEDAWLSMVESALISEGTYSVAHAAALPEIARRYPQSRIIDGAYGALLRGGFANQLLVRGRGDLASMDAARLEKWFVIRDLEIFHPDIRDEMRQGATAHLQAALDAMPRFKDSDGRDWIDEFFLRWRIPGFVANAQGIYDRWLQSSMPFLAPQVVSDVLALPPAQRSHGRLFRRWIDAYRPTLRSIPFVGKRGMVPWLCIGNPWRTTVYSRLAPKHPMADSGQMELGVIALMKESLAERAEDALSNSMVPFHEPLVRDLKAAACAGDRYAAQEFFSWLTLALALQRRR